MAKPVLGPSNLNPYSSVTKGAGFVAIDLYGTKIWKPGLPNYRGLVPQNIDFVDKSTGVIASKEAEFVQLAASAGPKPFDATHPTPVK